MQKIMQDMWDFVFDVLFCEKTNLIYENRTTYEKDGNVCNLPTPEQISLQVPNPCSWGTGMEDGMINAGIMLDTVLCRYAVTGDMQMKDYAKKLYLGIKLCSEVSGVPGFLARSVSPEDCKSYYINTSRDQYTHVIYSLTKYMQSDICDADDKENIKKILVGFATKVRDEATAENGYKLLRADGKVGAVCTMWNVKPHEALRLPMFYLAAFVASGDNEWLKLYNQYKDAAIDKTLEKHTACDMNILLQTQYSARYLYDYDPCPETKCKIKKVLEFVSAPANAFTIENIDAFDKQKVNSLATIWHECEIRYMWGTIVIGGYDYPIPQEPIRIYNAPLRELGSAIGIVSLCPDAKVSQNLLDLFDTAIKLIDPDTHASVTPVHFLLGYWLCKRYSL